VFWAIILLKKDISKFLNKLGQIYTKNMIFSCHNCTIFTCIPKYSLIAQFFPNTFLTIPAWYIVINLGLNNHHKGSLWHQAGKLKVRDRTPLLQATFDPGLPVE